MCPEDAVGPSVPCGRASGAEGCQRHVGDLPRGLGRRRGVGGVRLRSARRTHGIDRVARLRLDPVRDARRAARLVTPRRARTSRSGSRGGRPTEVASACCSRTRAGRARRASTSSRPRAARSAPTYSSTSMSSRGTRAGRLVYARPVRGPSRRVLRRRPQQHEQRGDARQRGGIPSVRRVVSRRQRTPPVVRLDACQRSRHGRDPRRDGRAHDQLPGIFVRHLPGRALRRHLPASGSGDGARRRGRPCDLLRRVGHHPGGRVPSAPSTRS